MSTDAFRDALHARGCPCEVEGRERLAVLRVSQPHATQFTVSGFRDQLLRLGREHGFTHVAVEIVV